MAELNFSELAVDEWFQGVLLETFRESKGTSRPRVRPVELLPRGIRVAFPRKLRTDNPIGTRFRADVKVCVKRGSLYLNALERSICKEESFRVNRVIRAIPRPGSLSGRAYDYVWDDPIDAFQEMRESAYAAARDELEAKEAGTTTRDRSAIIKIYALARSKGICEGCGSPAPFITRKGKPYLESHHLIPVSPSGADDPRNVAALCPNCHREVEYGENGERYNEEIRVKILKIETALDDVHG